MADESRRSFLKTTGLVVAGIVALPGPGRAGSGPLSQGYILVDSGKCQGCLTCMMTCAVANEGEANLSLSRLQVRQNPFGKYPDDLNVSQCRQCADPACVAACPAGALTADPAAGNVRAIDRARCVGCGSCVRACPFGEAILDAPAGKAAKCDLCASAKFLGQPGGPGGTQACVEICPMKAIRFTTELPRQDGDSGYDVNLRGQAWQDLGHE